ncbi:prolyl-tRNA synthetase associated domain-containing protein [Atopobacter sp. AH10]|uniref:prolyl-tRNA synthetase associated domain-containing protein n=1 Tax=Atopobacter sp. AH10 TaxID=2315861 RepID=UPI000EF23E6F|nr:prolyl-tRNA synthetase associated domain-containing protein [Atopobacter sp. AH10]RLK63122.1 prolyl-tRNA synthetase associated domain-containing protein [Atopobacter sp. AH10]
MGDFQQVKDRLEELGMTYHIVEHEAALTTEQADSFIEGMEGVRTKSMFLTNKKKTAFYLLVMDDSKRMDMEKVCEIVGEKRLKMASSASLEEQMQTKPGVVSPFGLMNNEGKNIHVYFDREILLEKIQTFHPNDNTKTIFLKTEDVLSFVKSIGFDYHIVDL